VPVSGTNLPLMLAVRTDGDPLSIASAVRQAVWSVDRHVPVSDLQPMRTMGGAAPATRAASVDPAEALRSDRQPGGVCL
jgi:hypothetical protein